MTHYEGRCGCPVEANSGQECGRNGNCVQGRCVCDPRYYGPACELLRCRGDECYGSDACFRNGTDSSVSECSGRCVAGHGVARSEAAH